MIDSSDFFQMDILIKSNIGHCDIAKQIFAYLGPFDLLAASQVCKDWQLFVDSDFELWYYALKNFANCHFGQVSNSKFWNSTVRFTSMNPNDTNPLKIS